MSLELTIGGCRGTHPVAQPDAMRYGGETTSFLVTGPAGERVLVDPGTGVRRLGARLQREAVTGRVLMLFSHYHLDHTMGLPALGLLYDPRWHVTMAAPRVGRQAVGSVIPRLLHAPFWPLQMEDLAAGIRFRDLAAAGRGRTLTWGRLRVRWCGVRHPGGCTAYRLEAGRAAIVIATDVEWGLSTAAEKAALLTLCRAPTPASLLIMDGQYAARTYAAHRGWGHSTWEECLQVARAAGVARLLVTHHAPDANDRALDRLARAVRRAWAGAGLARAGLRVRIG